MAYSTKKIHFFFSAFPAWGHIRPFCIFAARLVQENENAIATILISPNLLGKAQAEVSAELRGETAETILRRIRIISSFHSDHDDPEPFDLVPRLIETYGTVYKDLSQGNPISCAQQGTKFDAATPPSVVVLDFFAHAQMLVTRSVSGESVPIISWITGHIASILRLFGPEHIGGYGDLATKIETGAPVDFIYQRTNGSVVRIPGIPDMYDWEYFPQISAFEVPLSEVIKMASAGIRGGDGAFVTSTSLFENESLEAMKSWFSKMDQEVHVIGPLLPSEYGKALDNARGHTDVQLFLDKTLTERGQNSVILISFGSIFWPKERYYIEEVIEALIEKEFPFILSYASPFAKVSDELIERLKISGLGMISKWIPQQYILNHPATGWFITHAGHNSVMESLGSGVPMICWPFEADQPAAAAHLTENLDVAFELIEVRTGKNGLKPLLRNGRKAKGAREAVGVEIREILDACRGERGAELTLNAQKMKVKFAEAWGSDGASRKELRAFLNKYSLLE